MHVACMQRASGFGRHAWGACAHALLTGARQGRGRERQDATYETEDLVWSAELSLAEQRTLFAPHPTVTSLHCTSLHCTSLHCTFSPVACSSCCTRPTTQLLMSRTPPPLFTINVATVGARASISISHPPASQLLAVVERGPTPPPLSNTTALACRPSHRPAVIRGRPARAASLAAC
jgi:hypothetical protein